MQPDIRFFQAAATIIPTLLIAIVFTAKLFEPKAPDKTADEPGTFSEGLDAGLRRYLSWLNTIPVTLIVTCLVGLTIWGERTALAVLISDEPTERRALVVQTALISELTLLALAVLLPLGARLFEFKHWHSYIVVSIAAAGGIVALLLPA